MPEVVEPSPVGARWPKADVLDDCLEQEVDAAREQSQSFAFAKAGCGTVQDRDRVPRREEFCQREYGFHRHGLDDARLDSGERHPGARVGQA